MTRLSDDDRFEKDTTENPGSDAVRISSLSPVNEAFRVIRRNGTVTEFNQQKISLALSRAFLATEEGDGAHSLRIQSQVSEIALQVVSTLTRRFPVGGTLAIEDIQDQVELALMRSGHHKVARAYVLYREAHARRRAETFEDSQQSQSQPIKITNQQGDLVLLDIAGLETQFEEACRGVEDVSVRKLMEQLEPNLYQGIKETSLFEVLVLSARALIEQEPGYSQVAARLLLDQLHAEAFKAQYFETDEARQEALQGLKFETRDVDKLRDETAHCYGQYFINYLKLGGEHQLLDPQLLQFDLAAITESLLPERDLKFSYLGLQTLYDRYFIHHQSLRIELPQAFFMRVAMGLAINEVDRELRAVEFYKLLSSFEFMSSTPTLFNAGTLRAQLSSCYLTTLSDDLDGIYSAIKDNALLSKYAGGLGNDWTPVRGLGAHINGTNGSSQGVVPFLKVANDTAVAVNQGGKRKGAVCAYLETWHIDIEAFLELRKNTGDERRRTQDMNSANWLPDLFMQRVLEQQHWTLFSPDEVPDLHDLVGVAFEKRYLQYESQAAAGEIRISRRVDAQTLWRRILSTLFETGHPWLCFKDPCNLRYTNQHRGVVHSSNLCTEITLHTSAQEIAVCNLGSINLAAHVSEEQGIDLEHLRCTVVTAMRMLDNVVDINYYAVPQARHSNLRHRPVGLGLMGFQDALYKQRISYGSVEAVEFADRSAEALSYFAISASADLAVERGAYPSYQGSLWSNGILPLDSIELLAESRGKYLEMDRNKTLDWEPLRKKVQAQGMRNSNTLAIAPTATISNICGVSQSIEPTYQHLFVKSNLSGEFTQVNRYLVNDLKKLGLWDQVMVNDLKYFDGRIASIERIPASLRALYSTAFEMDSRWLIEAASRRQKWLDQSQSLNLYLSEASGSKLDELYKLAWLRGLKTTYYLRTLGATHVEKGHDMEDEVTGADNESLLPKVCSILEPDCEACQ
ncbi:ribonucleoside-diphosphate reductase subunit alpha [Motiliproteus sp. MSK22-1]|nr:ribonucleoside-diphosphate reductase subunit alpha [Motiliproteus sp. MSK22-1]